MAQCSSRHPKSDPQAQEDWKKLPKDWAAILQPEVIKERKGKILIQDGARGFRKALNYRTRILFYCGRLDLFPANHEIP